MVTDPKVFSKGRQPNYRLIEGGLYQLYWDDQPALKPMKEVALLIDVEAGSLLKHGHPELVQAHFERYQSQFRSLNLKVGDQIADDLVCITGAFDVEELNKCLAITGYAGTFYRDLQGIEPPQHMRPTN